MNTALNSFALSARSAWFTARFCDRVARRHYRRSVRFGWQVYSVLSSDDAIRTYRLIWGVMQLACMFTIWLGMATRDAVQSWADGLVESSLVQEEAIAPEAPAEEPTTAEPELPVLVQPEELPEVTLEEVEAIVLHPAISEVSTPAAEPVVKAKRGRGRPRKVAAIA